MSKRLRDVILHIRYYYHHPIGSMTHLPLFRVRSWNNGIRCMSLCILINRFLYVFCFRSEDFFTNLSTYKHDNTRRILKVLKIDGYPQINSTLLRTYFKHLSRRHIFPLVRKNTMCKFGCCYNIPPNTWRNNNVVITSKRFHLRQNDVVLT